MMLPDFTMALEELNKRRKNTMMETLQLEYTAAGEGFLEARMPVNSRVHQPMGYLHGGATMALAESVGSAASAMYCLPLGKRPMGLEFSANHIRSIKEGEIFARAEAIHLGKTTHLWQIRITNEKGELISLCKITNIILD